MKLSLLLALLLTPIVSAKEEFTTYTATAYCLKGKMANGKRVHKGAIAADPRVLKMGTKVRIKDYGVFTVSDTGGRIKGKKLDLWYGSCQEARKFGKRKVELSIV